MRSFYAAQVSDYSNVAQATTGPPPTAPSGLTATAISSGRIDLAWIDNASGETGFKVERSSNGVSFVEIAVLGPNVQSYSSTGLAGSTTYHYRVRAYDGPNHSSYSNVASATTLAPPAAPTGLTATAVSSSRVNLAWIDNATNETGYKLESVRRRLELRAGGQPVGQRGELREPEPHPATTYHYRVGATDGANTSYSGIVAVTTLPVPPAPSSLAATAVSSSRINLTWVDNASYETGYKVERSPNGVSFTQIALLWDNVTTYADTSLTAGTAYHYRVRASDGASNHSAYSNVATTTTLAVPGAPSNLTATPVSPSGINLAWTDTSAYEQGYKVESSTDGINFAQIASVGVNVTSYANTSLTAGTTYHYRVRAYDGPNHSSYSNVASATTQAPPAAPSNLVATAVSSSRINLTWVDNATNETGYKVERSPNGVSFTQIALLWSVTTYADTSLTAGTAYHYRVRAYEGASNHSAYSNVAMTTTLAAPSAPSNLTATPVSPSGINLAWTDTSAYEQGYKVESSTDGVNFAQIASVGANVTSYANTSLTAGTTYHYRVRAYDGPNHSSYSNVASATTQAPPAAPSNLVATAVSSSRINLTWVDNATNESRLQSGALAERGELRPDRGALVRHDLRRHVAHDRDRLPLPRPGV